MVCTCALNDILRACFAKCSLCVAQTSEFSHPPTPPKSVGWQVVSHARRLKTGTMRPTYRRLPMLAAKQGLCCRMFLLLHSCASMSCLSRLRDLLRFFTHWPALQKYWQQALAWLSACLRLNPGLPGHEKSVVSLSLVLI